MTSEEREFIENFRTTVGTDAMIATGKDCAYVDTVRDFDKVIEIIRGESDD